MQGLTASLGIGVVTGMRTMTACAALSWAASLGRTRPGSDWARALTEDATAAGLATALMCFAERQSSTNRDAVSSRRRTMQAR